MEEHDMRKKAEVESAKARLEHTKRMMMETMARIEKTEAEHQEGQNLFFKKMKGIQTVQGSQSFKVSKLNAEVKNLESVLLSRKEELEELQRANADLKDEKQKAQDEVTRLDREYSEALEALEDEIKMGYVQIQNEKEVEVLLEMALSSLKTEEQLPFMKEVLNRSWEETKKRQNELKEQLNELEEAQKKVEREIKAKEEELTQVKDKYASLSKEYNVTKKQDKKGFS